jgi:hypothetical protein
MTTDQIDTLTISMMDKAGNGYMCAVDPAFFAVVIGILGPEHKFVKVPGVEKMKINEILKIEDGKGK